MSHLTSMESMNSLASQDPSFCSNASTESQVSVVRRPVAPSYPSIDSVLKASVPSPITPPDSWTLESANNSTIDLDQPPPADPEHPESIVQERPISYLAPLPSFPIVKRIRHVRTLSSHIPFKVGPSTSAMPLSFMSTLSSLGITRQNKTSHPRNPADSTGDDQRPPIPERESSLEFLRRQQEQQELAKMYLTTYPSLPASAPAGHPHIIDSTKVSWPPPHGIGFADMVVTILYNHGPATLTSFLDLRTPKFIFWYTRGVLKRFYIERNKCFVTIGLVQAGNKKKVEEGLTYRIREERGGAWEPLCAMGKMNGLCSGPREMDAYVRKVFVMRLMREMGWIKEGGSGSKFMEGEM